MCIRDSYYIWALQIAGVGTLLSGVNLLVTIVKMRAPGMSLMRMPVFTLSLIHISVPHWNLPFAGV